jgi:phage-related protein (TIGR01555 family)
VSDAPIAPIKPRVRVQAYTSDSIARVRTADSFQNFAANLGYGTNNLSSASTYGFNPLSRNHTLLEWMYRGAWLVRKVVDVVADDMTREGVNIESDMPPDRIDSLNQYWNDLQIWSRLNSVLKWSRLYGGALGVIMIEGQDISTPLRVETVSKNQFKGILVLDRWMVWPHIENPVTDFGPDFGMPKFYDTVADARSIPNMKIHHSRCIRLDGIELPYWQLITENGWGASVIEPVFDRMIAFDSSTQGAAQLIYKAHLRVLKIENLREIIAAGGKMADAVKQFMQLIRVMQSIEGMTVLDKADDFESQSYTFAGLSDMMLQFGQQVAGAADIPMTRLFAQSPAGLNSTGDSDLRNYYDGTRSQQEARLRRFVTRLFHITHQSHFGEPLPDGFNYKFAPLWQLTELEKSQIAGTIAGATSNLLQDRVFTLKTAMMEIRQSSRITGFGSNITDEDLDMAEQADALAPLPGQPEVDPQTGMPMQGGPGMSGAAPAMPESTQTPAAGENTEPLLEGPQAESEKPDDTDDQGIPLSGNALLLRHIIRARQMDALSMVDVGPLTCIIETPKGEARKGYGWSTVMPAHYGYISGTSSAEGPREQMDCFIGDDEKQEQCWVIEQLNPDSGVFDEHKCMLRFSSREQALTAYKAAFSDGRGSDRIGTIRQMTVAALKGWLDNHRYGRGEPPVRAVK